MDVVTVGLDREERGREAAAVTDMRLNFPVDVPKPVSTIPVGYGIGGGSVKPGEFWTEPVRADKEGGDELDLVIGEFRAVPTDQEMDEVKRNWKLKFPDEESPYDLDDPRTGAIEYDLMLAHLRRGMLRNVGEPVEGYESKPVELSEVDVVIETGLDISKVRNRRIREALKRLGGEDFVRDVWAEAEEMTLVAPVNERAKWVMQLVGKSDENGKRKLLAMTLSDWERMLVVRDDNGEEREVRLPDPGDGTYEKVPPLVRALFKLNFRGRNLPHGLKLSREFLR